VAILFSMLAFFVPFSLFAIWAAKREGEQVRREEAAWLVHVAEYHPTPIGNKSVRRRSGAMVHSTRTITYTIYHCSCGKEHIR
jgi:hypothetical protein